MSQLQNNTLAQVETTCGTLLNELQIIWNEVGENENDRDMMLLELERECLEVYRRRVDQANRSRAQLRQAIAEHEAELAVICAAMGERPVHIRQSDQNPRSLKEELKAILPQIEEMRKRKFDRRNKYVEVLEKIQKISNEIHSSSENGWSIPVFDESDLSIRKLEELERELHKLQKEKDDRLKHVLELLGSLNSLCSVLGLDFKQTLNEVYPSLGNNSEETHNISNATIESLTTAIKKLLEIKLQRMQRLQDLASSMLELWNLMDTPVEEQQIFQHVTCKIAASEQEMTEPNMLSSEFINDVELEVSRLYELKSSKMKELVLKKRTELDEICRKTHLIPESDGEVETAIAAIESGAVDPACVLEQIEMQIARVKEEALSRKDILEKVEKWLGACEEECWLEEYNRDENRYNAGRGAHLILKRAEKARILVNKLPGMVEALTSRTIAWETEMGIQFSYDGIRLLSMLEEYAILRQEKELERKRQRDQKKLQGQLITEQEALFGSKPSPMKLQSGKTNRRLSTGGAPNNRRISLGGTMLQTPKPEKNHTIKATPSTRQIKKMDFLHANDQLVHPRKDAFAALATAAITREVESPIRRMPFSPIASTESSKSNLPNLMEDLNRKPNDQTLKKTLQANNTHMTTPTKTIFANQMTSPTKTLQTDNTHMTTPTKTIFANQMTSPTKTLQTDNIHMTTPTKAIFANQMTTPTKTIFTTQEENMTPKAMTIPVPSTPSTVSVPMQTAVTPAPPSLSHIRKALPELTEEIEYSFEERRAGFGPSSHPKVVLQV